jgi:hypothetical protein
MERVQQSAVVRAWLRREAANPAVAFDADPSSLSEQAALTALIDRKPGASRFLVTASSLRWYRTTLDYDAVRSLRLIACPADTLWAALSPDGTVGGAADRIAANDADRLAAETGVDVGYICSLSGSGPADPLVVHTPRGWTHWTVADGNHRAVARALAQPDNFTPQETYLAVRPNPVAGPLLSRLLGSLWRLTGRSPPPPR